jgi:hypothetical protein
MVSGNRRIIFGLSVLALVSILVFQNCAEFKSISNDGTSNRSSDSLVEGFDSNVALPGEFFAANGGPELGPAANPVNNLQYYGYPFMRLEPELIPEIASHTNAFSLFYRPDHPEDDEKLRQMVSAARPDFKLMIFVNEVFQSPTTHEPYAENQARANVAKLKAAIAGNLKNVAYLAFDEPALRITTGRCLAISSNTAPCIEKALYQAPDPKILRDTIEFLERSAVLLRESFPGIGLADIESGPFIKAVNPFPENFDLYGFDCYTPMDNCFGTAIPTLYQNMRNFVTEMNMRLGGFRRLAMIPEATLSINLAGAAPVAVSTGKNEDEAIAVFNSYFNLIKNDPMVILIGVWIWQSFPESNNMFQGARGLPKLRARVEEKGREITGKSTVVWNKPPVIEFVVSDINVGEKPVWFWSTTGATSCYSVTDRNAYQNLPPNGFMQTNIENVARVIEYTLGCRGLYGDSQKTIRFTVRGTGSGLQTPAITYANNNLDLNVAQQMQTIHPTNSGGAISNCTVTPNLPTGLNLSATTCAISGTPSVEQVLTSHRIRATNATGYSEAFIQIRVLPAQGVLQAPYLGYANNAYTLTQGSSTAIPATNSGGVISNCVISPNLPAGLNISNSSCEISGTPSVSTAAISYTVSASNTAGTSNKQISISIGSSLQKPSITYSVSQLSLTQNVTMPSVSASNSGGAMANCTISPALPPGLTFTASACGISGRPTTVSNAISYTVQATNSQGTSTAAIIISVAPQAPNIAYSLGSFELVKDSALLPELTVNNSGGTITGCTVTPALPTGLNLSNTTCAISGTPKTNQAATAYKVRASNTGGYSEVQINIAVKSVEVLNCRVTNRVLSSYSLEGTIVPNSTHVGLHGYFFVAGYDVIQNVWYSFDGIKWTKHADNLNSSFSAIGGVDTLIAEGISGSIFNNENLSAFPGGMLYIGYGIGADKVSSWNNMMTNQRHKVCDTLPAQ